jgi:hypothetical protein
MTSRSLFASVLLRPKAAEAIPVVDDMNRLNEFAGTYNRYAQQLQRGIIDLKLWNQFIAGFKKLTS